MKTRIAFYRGRKSQNDHALIGDRLICWVTGKPFSHCELVVSLVTLGSEVYSTMLSSSLRDGGVRGVSRKLVPGRWLVVEFDGDSKPAIQYIRGRIGTPYGWLDLLTGQLLGMRRDHRGVFCSEACAKALGLRNSPRMSPQGLLDACLDINKNAVFI